VPCYLLYGEDTFSSRRKLEEIKSRFFYANMGDINITVLEGESLAPETLQRAACLIPFLAPKRLVIVKNLLNKGKNESKKRIAELLETFPPFSIVVFYEEGEVDKNSELYKKLKAKKGVQRFPLLPANQLLRWAEREVEAKGGQIEREALYRLVQIVGPDLWRASLEIEKLVSYKKKGIIKKEDVETLVREEIHPKIFELIDALGERNIKKAYSLLSELISFGENESYILSMIAYQFRNLLIVKEFLEKGRPLDSIGLHPYALKKAKIQANNFTNKQLREIYGKLLEADINIKTGNLKPHVALDLLISEFLR